MARIEENVSDDRVQYFIDKYNGKIKFAGMQHGAVKQVEALINNTKPNPNKLFVIEGIWAHQKAKNYGLKINSFFFCPDFIRTVEAERMIDDFVNSSENAYIVSKKVFLKMSERENPDGLLGTCYLPKFEFDDIRLSKSNLVVILDGLEIPGNIGTIIRSVDGVGGDGVIICNRKARLTHPKLIKASQGSNFTIPIIESDSKETIKWLKKHNFSIYLTDTRGAVEYYEADYKGRVAIVAGSERYGISDEWYEGDYKAISIPMSGDCDSLNVAIATTIVLYEASIKQAGKVKIR